jgi:dihydrofolate reductase
MNAVIMGRRTWESLNRRPLQNRVNFIVSSSIEQEDTPGAFVVRSLDHAHEKIKCFPFIQKVFVIGGERLYKEALYNHRYTTVFMTTVKRTDQETILYDACFPLQSLAHRYKLRYESDELVRGDYIIQFHELVQ